MYLAGEGEGRGLNIGSKVLYHEKEGWSISGILGVSTSTGEHQIVDIRYDTGEGGMERRDLCVPGV